MTTRTRWLRPALIALALIVPLLAAGGWLLARALPPPQLAALLTQQVRQATGRELRIGGELALHLWPRLAVVASDVSLSNMAGGSQPQMLQVRRLRLAVALWPLLQRRVEIDRVALEGVDLLLETDRRGHGNWLLRGQGAGGERTTTGDDAGSAAQVAVEQLLLQDLRLRWRDGRSGSHHELRIDRATLAPQGERTRIDARVTLQQQRWELQGSSGRIAALADAAADWPLELHARTSGAELKLSGRLRGGSAPRELQGELSAQLSARDAIAPWTDAALPLPLSLQAQLSANAQRLQAPAIAATLAGQPLRGQLTAELGPPLRIDARLQAQALDLTHWQPARSAQPAPAKAVTRRWLFPDTPLPITALPQAHATVVLQVDRLVLPALPPITDFSAKLRVSPSALQLEPIRFAAAGGRLQAGLQLQPTGSGRARVSLRADGDGLQLDELMRAASKPGQLQGGSLQLRSRLELQGGSWRALAAGANGEVLLSASGTRLAGRGAASDAQLLPRLLGLITGKPGGGPMRIDCAVARLPLQQGIAKIDRSIAIETDQFVASARGEVRLTDETLALTLHPTARAAPGLKALSLASLVRIDGPLLEPAVSIDPTALAGAAAAIGAAGATGGWSLLAQQLLQRDADPHPCRFASTGQGTPTPAAPAAPQRTAPNPLQGLPDALRGLFKKK